MKKLLILAVVVTAVSQIEAINTQGGIRTAAAYRSYCHKNGMNYEASPQGGYCRKAGLLGSTINTQGGIRIDPAVIRSNCYKKNMNYEASPQGGYCRKAGLLGNYGPGGTQKRPNIGGGSSTWAPKNVNPKLGPNGTQKRPNIGGNSNTWPQRMTGNQGGSY